MLHTKDALWLTKFELKHSMKNFLLFIPILLLTIIVLRSLVPGYLEQSTTGLDFLMFTAINLIAPMTRPKVFQLQKINGLFYAAPFIILLNKLGVPKDVIIKSRFISYFIINSLFVALLFTGLYPAFQDVLSISSYLVFAFTWYCMSIYLGCLTPAYEAASNLAITIAISLVAGFVLFFSYILLFYKWFEDGFVSWMMYIATDYPVWTIVISLLLSVIGWNFWMKIMKRNMTGANYL